MMKRRLAAVAARAMRVVRGLWPGRNPLRRTVDRAEGLIVGVLAAAFLAVAPLAAVTAEHVAYDTAAHAARAEQAAWHQVPALLLASAPARGYGYAYDYQPSAPARWRAPDGTQRAGPVPASWGARADATVRVWVDAAGRVTGPPLRLSQADSQAVVAATFAPLAFGVVMLCAGLLAHAVLTRRRLAGWEADWRVTGPQWSRPR
jgi:hypothetical protein